MHAPEHPSKPPAVRLLAGLAVAGTIAVIAARSGGVSGDKEVEWLTQLAKSGDAGAQLQLGLAYMDGRYGLNPDPVSGQYWLKTSAKGGNAYAADAIANIYASNSAEELQQALPWWQLGAHGGNADAELHLGEFMHLTGHDNQAVAWLRDAADRGDNRARSDLLSLYRTQAVTENDLHRGENPIAALGERSDSAGLKTLYTVWRTVKASSPITHSSDALIERAEYGDPVAEYQLAIRYNDGSWAVERNPQQAITWLKRSADAGNQLAVKTLAEFQHSERVSLGNSPGAATGGNRT